jgi:hypothetical protein
MQPRDDWRRQIYRASNLDSYREYMGGEHYDGSEYTSDDFIKRMTAFEPSPAMDAGTAVHKLIEDIGFGVLPIHSDVNGWHVHFDLDEDVPVPLSREVPLFREHNSIPLFGRCDAMSASAVHDIKTTSQIDVDRYMDSFQWRAYLWMSGRQRFVYDIFRVKLEADIKVVTVLEYVPLKLSFYPNLDDDVEHLLTEFDACVKALAIPEIMQRKVAA